MPVSPELAEQLAKGLVELYTEAEERLLATLARRLARGIDEPGWPEAKLAELRVMRGEVEDQLRILRRTGDAKIADAIGMAYNRGVAAAGTDLAAAGAMPQVAFGVTDVRAVRALVAETVAQVDGTHLRILRSTIDGYRDAVAAGAGQVQVGAATRRDAAGQVLQRFAARGITGFVDRAGRSWDLATYAEMSVRTATGRAAVQGHVDRLVQGGRDLVIVSESTQECELCRPWEGKVLSIGGTGRGTIVAEDLDDGRVDVEVAGTLRDAIASGLFHANCRHSVSAYLPGVTRPMRDTEDAEGDADRQRLRYLERGVREWRRREAAALSPAEAAKAKAKVAEWQGRIRAHVDTTSAKRQPQRERLGAR